MWWDSVIVGSVAGVLVAFANWLTQRANRQKLANDLEAANQKVAAALRLADAERKLENDKLSTVIHATHALVNSNMEAQLRINEISAAALYKADPSDEHKALWDQAAAALAEHEAKQARADDRGNQ